MNLTNILEYRNDDYYFQDVIENLEGDSAKEIFDKFLLSYFARVSYLFANYREESLKFSKWFDTIGNNKFLIASDLLEHGKGNIKRLIKILINYDIMLEQAISEHDVDCLLEVLIDIPIEIERKARYF
jgi:hypothetical protein